MSETKRPDLPARPALPPTTPESLMELAIAKGISPDGLKVMAEVWERLQAKNAEVEFARAMAQFQAECPIILKKKVIDFPTTTGGKFKSHYAEMDAIVEDTRELRRKYGFSYRFDRAVTDKYITVTCIIQHAAGHHTATQFAVPAPQGGKLSAQHDVASAVTFCERYAFRGGFGITTGMPDDDGKRAFTVEPLAPDKVLVLAKLVTDCGVQDSSAFWQFAGLEDSHDLEQLPARDFERVRQALLQRKARGERQ
jgi:hypothetical protein